MASRGINKVILVGNLGKDPEVRYTAAGSAITSASLATSESYKDKNTGQNVDKTEWHSVVFFGKLAEIAGEYLRKGSQIYIEGKLKTTKYTDNNGVEKYSTDIVVDGFDGKLQMLGSNESNNQQQQQQASQQQGGYSQPQHNQAPQQRGFAPHGQQQGWDAPMNTNQVLEVQPQGGFTPNGGQVPQ